MTRSILDPPVPYVGPITINPGSMIRIQGTVPSMAYRFNIKLQCGPEVLPQDDIALQISVKVLDSFITLNSVHYGFWGEQQRMLTSSIKRSERFELVLICEFNHFKVIFNDRYSCKFSERIHYGRISHLAIDGDVSIIKISYESDSPNRPTEASTRNPLAPTASFEEFEPVSTRTSTSPRNMRPSSLPEASAPPSYQEATSDSLRELSSIRPTPNNPPYPTSDAIGMPIPTLGTNSSPNISRGGSAPIGINVPLDTNPAYGAPLGAPVPLNAYSSSNLPPGAPIPLNAPNSNFRPIKRTTTKTCCIICSVVAAVFGFFLFIMIVVIVSLK